MSKPATKAQYYRERVTPKWTSFLPIALVLPTFWLTLAPINAPLGMASGLLASIGVIALMLVSAPVIEVTPGYLRVGKAKIDTKFLGAVQIAPAGTRFADRVPNLDPRAYLALQNSRSGLIKLEIIDKSDPTPYWVFSTKNAEMLAEAIKAAKKAA